MTDIRRDPAYSDGFHDAAQGEPLFDTASDAYAAGWRAYWAAREALDTRTAPYPGGSEIFLTSNPD